LGNAYYGNYPTAGANDLSATDSIFMISNCQFIGGSGGSGAAYGCHGAAGGDGIRFSGTGFLPAECYLRDCSQQGGIGGGGSTCGPPGPDGLPLDFSGSALLIPFPAAHRALEAPGLVRENAAIPLVFIGVPGDRVTLFYSRVTRFELSTPFQGVFLFGTAARSARIGTVPAGGILNATLHISDLGTGVEAGLLYMQGMFVPSTGTGITLGSSAIAVVLDSAP
jgi:hypothetical protein